MKEKSGERRFNDKECRIKSAELVFNEEKER